MTERFVQLGMLMLSALCAWGQPSSVSPVPSAVVTQNHSQVLTAANNKETKVVNHSLLLSNRAVLIVSQARGMDASAVRLKFSDSMSGRFEIPMEGAKDIQ